MADDLQDRVHAVERLTRLFRAERLVYLFVTGLSLLLLLTAAALMVRDGKAGAAELSLMFGSSGLVTFTAGRLLNMWDQALRMVAPSAGRQEDGR